MRFSSFLTTALFFAASLVASGQSFNIDLDIGTGGPEIGNGAPSSTFSASGLPGYWNRVYAGGPTTPVTLLGLNGVATSAQLSATGGVGGSGGYNFAGNTGDMALLLNDSADVGNANIYHFTGLVPGHYYVLTYAVKANTPNVPATVTLPGALVETQIVTGPMPGNALILGVTHCIHDLQLNGTSFDITISGGGPPNPQVNGFQIVAVPEPTTIFVSGFGLVALARRRKRRK
jgi:hypothetical protein